MKEKQKADIFPWFVRSILNCEKKIRKKQKLIYFSRKSCNCNSFKHLLCIQWHTSCVAISIQNSSFCSVQLFRIERKLKKQLLLLAFVIFNKFLTILFKLHKKQYIFAKVFSFFLFFSIHLI